MTMGHDDEGGAGVTITIMTPVFNGAAHIEHCVRNVAAQGCDVAEHLVIDGASEDGTVDILRRLAPEFPRMRWISERDRGQADAMNKGRQLARGEIIGVINADDYYEPGAVTRALALFRQLPTESLLVGACNVRDAAGRIIYVNRPRRLSLKAFLAGFDHPVNPSAYFYHATLHDRAGGFDVNDHFSLDIDFLYRAVQSGNVFYCDEIWGNFIEWPEAKTVRDKDAQRASARIRVLKDRYRPLLSPAARLSVRLITPFVVGARKICNTLRRPRETARRYGSKLRVAGRKLAMRSAKSG